MQFHIAVLDLVDLYLQDNLAAVGEFNGIAEQIHDDLTQARGVGNDNGGDVGAMMSQTAAPRSSLRR